MQSGRQTIDNVKTMSIKLLPLLPPPVEGLESRKVKKINKVKRDDDR